MMNIDDENSQYRCNMQNIGIYDYNKSGCLNIGDKAPEFHANTTFGQCDLNDYRRKMVSTI